MEQIKKELLEELVEFLKLERSDFSDYFSNYYYIVEVSQIGQNENKVEYSCNMKQFFSFRSFIISKLYERALCEYIIKGFDLKSFQLKSRIVHDPERAISDLKMQKEIQKTQEELKNNQHANPSL